MPHFMTFDLEHWYEGYRYRSVQGWDAFPSRDHRIVQNVLRLLDEHSVKATFFTTGRFAEEFSSVVSRIAEQGHEVASHSYSHTMVHRFESFDEFDRDLKRSLNVLRQIVGDAVRGFRAPKWSLPKGNLQRYYQILADNGLRYDSSLYPMGLTRKRYPYYVCEHNGFWEIPAGTVTLAGVKIPAAGGLWLRLWPRSVSIAALRQAEKEGRPGTVYLHPYDLDWECPRLDVGPNPNRQLFAFARHYRLDKSEGILRNLLQRFQFTSIRDWLATQGYVAR